MRGTRTSKENTKTGSLYKHDYHGRQHLVGALRKLKQEAGWASRGVQAHWHIPKYLLDKFAALLDFDIAHVRSAAERNLLRGNLAMMEHIAV